MKNTFRYSTTQPVYGGKNPKTARIRLFDRLRTVWPRLLAAPLSDPCHSELPKRERELWQNSGTISPSLSTIIHQPRIRGECAPVPRGRFFQWMENLFVHPRRGLKVELVELFTMDVAFPFHPPQAMFSARQCEEGLRTGQQTLVCV